MMKSPDTSSRGLSFALLLAVAAGAPLSLPVHASSAKAKPAQMAEPRPAPDRDEAPVASKATRLVLFNYDPNLTYGIISRDNLFTHIELRPGEKVQGLYLSDTVRWKHHVAANKERIFIKPTGLGLFNSGTLVTDRRVYELTMRSVGEGEAWYQRIQWHVDGEGAPSAGEASGVYEAAVDDRGYRGGMSGMSGAPRAADRWFAAGDGATPAAATPGSVNPKSLNFGYSIDGSATFRPTMVFDDGKFTWLQMSTRQELPAVFSLAEDGGAEVIDYTVHGNYLLISQLVPGILLKLGAQEVRVKRKADCTGFFCGRSSNE